MDGITALKKIRESDDKTYILMLTAKAEVDDRVTGLDSGADDYITKPFSLKDYDFLKNKKVIIFGGGDSALD